MDWGSIIIALIGAAGPCLGTYFAVKKSNNVRDYKLDELTREVREHNNFARRMPVLEEKITVANKRIKDLENKVE